MNTQEVKDVFHLMIGDPFYLQPYQLDWLLNFHPTIVAENREYGLHKQIDQIRKIYQIANKKFGLRNVSFDFKRTILNQPQFYYNTNYFVSVVDLLSCKHNLTEENIVTILGKHVQTSLRLDIFIGDTLEAEQNYTQLNSLLQMYLEGGDITPTQVAEACPYALSDSYSELARSRIAFMRAQQSINADISLKKILQMSTSLFIDILCSGEATKYFDFCSLLGYCEPEQVTKKRK